MKVSLLFGLSLLIIAVSLVYGGKTFYINSCLLGCKRKRRTVTVIPPYSPYGLVHTFLDMYDSDARSWYCYHLDQDGPHEGYCSSIRPCGSCSTSVRYSNYTDCPEVADHFASYWRNFSHTFAEMSWRRDYQVFDWNCQVYVNLLKEYLLWCRPPNDVTLGGDGDK